MQSTWLNILGYIAGILVVISMLPQVIKSFRTRSTKDISLSRSIIYAIGVALWTLYGILIHNGPLTAMNSIGATLGIIMLVLKLKHG